MKKIIFVGIILVSGLFSLQYSIMGHHGDKLNQKKDVGFTTAELPGVVKEYEVVYICPDDTATINKLHKSFDLLL